MRRAARRPATRGRRCQSRREIRRQWRSTRAPTPSTSAPSPPDGTNTVAVFDGATCDAEDTTRCDQTPDVMTVGPPSGPSQHCGGWYVERHRQPEHEHRVRHERRVLRRHRQERLRLRRQHLRCDRQIGLRWSGRHRRCWTQSLRAHRGRCNRYRLRRPAGRRRGSRKCRGDRRCVMQWLGHLRMREGGVGRPGPRSDPSPSPSTGGRTASTSPISRTPASRSSRVRSCNGPHPEGCDRSTIALPAEDWPGALAVDPSVRTAYVASSPRGTVSVIALDRSR